MLQKQSQELVVNKPNILDRPKKVSSAGGGVSNNNANAASGGGGAAPVDIRKLTVRHVHSGVHSVWFMWDRFIVTQLVGRF